MFGTGYCSGLVGWALMVGVWLVVLGLAVWAVTRLFPSVRRRDDVEAELDRRLASGELDPTSYQRVRDEPAGAGRR